MSTTAHTHALQTLIADQSHYYNALTNYASQTALWHMARQAILNTQISLNALLDNRIVLPTINDGHGGMIFNNGELSDRELCPLDLEYAAKVTLPPSHHELQFTLHVGSNLGGLPNGTIIDYLNIYYVIEGNDFIGFRLTELTGV